MGVPSQRGNMAILLRQIKGIIKELTRLQTLPAPYRDSNDNFALPRMIGTGSGGSIIVSRKIDDAIVAVADQLMNADSTLTPKITHAEWRSSTRHAFGPVLSAIDLNVDLTLNAKTVLAEVRAALIKRVAGYGCRDFAFGCTLFGNTAIQPFTIGPVRFEPRLDWLERKHQDGEISAITRRRVEQAWTGKYIGKQKLSYDSIGETGILDAVGSCHFVCSIATNGLASESGREKALTAAHLATASISLLWQTPSRALEGMNLLFDSKLHQQSFLTYIPGKIVLAGSRLSHMPHGPWMKTGEWETEFSNYNDHFAVVGRILEFIIDPTGDVSQQNMMNTLAQALLWFHEGCRETTSLMAIVKFSATLDALACGRRSDGIMQLIKARLGIQDCDQIHPGGPTLRQAVNKIYSDGRSRTIHGTNNKLGHDWTGTKGLAEQFARICLLLCIDWVEKNPYSDDPSQLSK